MSYIVSWKCSKNSSSLRSSHEPAIIALLHHVDDVSLAELHLILVLGLVVVQGAESTNNDILRLHYLGILNKIQALLKDFYLPDNEFDLV